MIKEQHLIQEINANDDVRYLKNTEALNIENCRMGLSLNGYDKRNEFIPSTLLIPNSYLPNTGTNTTIGSAVDPVRRRLIFFNYNSAGNHAIYAYDIPGNKFYLVLQNSNVTGGLNFSLSYPIDRSARVLNDELYWTDDYNEPRCINIESGIRSNFTPGTTYVGKTITTYTIVFQISGTPTANDYISLYVQAVNGNTQTFNYTVTNTDTITTVTNNIISLINSSSTLFAAGGGVAGSVGSISITNNAHSNIMTTSTITIVSNTYNSTAYRYTFPLQYSDITWIKKPPIKVLQVNKNHDSSFVNNFTADNSFQFCYYYEYYDNKKSALSSFSRLIAANYASDNYNSVVIKVPSQEQINPLIVKINLCVRFGNTGKTFIVRTFDRNNSSDAQAITNHNNLIGQLTYTFYNNQLGTALDDVFSVNSFDSVPLSVKTFEIARNRIFPANIVSGYTSPLTTSLAGAAQTLSSGSAIATTWKMVNWNYYNYDSSGNLIGTSPGGTFYYIDLSPNAVLPRGYAWDAYATGTGLPSTIDLSTAQYTSGVTGSTCDVGGLFNAWYNAHNAYNPYTQAVADLSTIGNTTTSVTTTASSSGFTYQFKTGCAYRLCVNFYDRFKRKCGVVTSDSLNIPIPERSYSTSTFNNVIQWTLSNTNALTEIPDFGYFFSIGITKNQTMASFIEAPAADVKYVVKNADGTYTFTTTAYLSTLYGVGINISGLQSNGAGYVYNEGDLVKLYISGSATNVFNLRVIGQSGAWVIVSLADVGSLTSPTALFTLYTPYAASSNEPFYEATDIFDINNPGTSTRSYGSLSGYVYGDVWYMSVGNYQVMSPDYKVWSVWDRDLGWVNIKDSIGQQSLPSTILFSDTTIAGSRVNEFNKFQPLNRQSIDSDSGDIQKLILTNKLAQQLGTVMLCICKNEPLSIYLGETQLVSQTGNAYVAQSNGVIGTINALRGNYGTLHPESVIDYLGEVYWFDVVHGTWIQYSSNGTVEVNYKLDRYFKKMSLRYLQQGLTSRVISCVDPLRYHLMCAIPATETSAYPYQMPSYGGVVPSYGTTLNSKFDLYDGQAKTLFFDVKDNLWNYVITANAEWLDYAENKVYGFHNGNLYQHEGDASSYNNFYGTNYPARVAFVGNKNASLIKDLFNISVEANIIPDYTIGYSNYPNEQITDLIASDYRDFEGRKKAAFYRDRLSPNVSGAAELKMYQGDFVKCVTPFIMLEFNTLTTKLALNYIELGYSGSEGQGQ